MTHITLTPSERAKTVVDFFDVNETDTIGLVIDNEKVLLPFQVTDDKTKEIVLFGHGHHVTINDKKFDKDRIDLTQKKIKTEIWEVYNEIDMMGGMLHPFHVHVTQFQVVSVNGEEPKANLKGFKDTISVALGDRIKIAVKFEEGVHIYYWYILEHGDNGMMGQIKVQQLNNDIQ